MPYTKFSLTASSWFIIILSYVEAMHKRHKPPPSATFGARVPINEQPKNKRRFAMYQVKRNKSNPVNIRLIHVTPAYQTRIVR
jgi:hypothetical protein